MAKAKQPRAGYIYALSDPGTGEIRYVGQTASPKRREWLHHSASNNKGGRRVNRWIRKLIEGGARPAMSIVEECCDMDARDVHWIKQYRANGADLLNMNEGGASTDFLRKSPKSHVSRGKKDALHVVRASWQRDITSAEREGHFASAGRLRQKLRKFEASVKEVLSLLGVDKGHAAINARFAHEVLR